MGIEEQRISVTCAGWVITLALGLTVPVQSCFTTVQINTEVQASDSKVMETKSQDIEKLHIDKLLREAPLHAEI